MSTFKAGDRVRIKASVTDKELDDIFYPIDLRHGEKTVRYVVDNDEPGGGVSFEDNWGVYGDMIELVDSSEGGTTDVG